MMMNQTALIVEDDRLLADIFSRALRDVDYDTELARDGQEALAWLAQRAPELLVLDLHLPHVSGEKVLDYVERNEQFAGTKVMIVTADATFGLQLDGRANLLLIKPVDVFQMQRLAQRLRQM
ncbi:MAG: response regulator [Chloroflexota bacterium]